MGSLKRKSGEAISSESPPPPQKKKHHGEDVSPLAEEAVGCVHDVSYPEGYVPSASSLQFLADSKPAKEFPFTLDPFQSEAINCLNRGESVLVSAHTSAGKTVVALYAIAMSLRNNQRVIYTSPIKALSNQKYREFKEEFSDVGLMTGDVTIDPNASCLVMTTEIWRSMQYKGSEIVREVAWVVFDEVHYMRDRERGVVWEESIVMAPKNSRFVFLSATVPNAKEFADWVAKVHKQPCHIVYTDYRPTPLQHYIFPAGGDGLFLVVDEKGKFREDSFQKSLNALVPTSESDKKRNNGKSQNGLVMGKVSEQSDIFKLVKMIIQRQYDPVIIFSFSKRECEFLAMQMAKMDLNDDDEKGNIETVFWSAMDMLSDDDKKLPQVSNMLPLLKRGIGVHHSGLLPILKEVIEILFQEGLIKCLFATETFSIGLNMPAKTVVFTNVRKFDGDKFRWISSGEYIQMSGRAGRRGIDARGICILMVDERMEPSTAKMMLKGNADSLNSAFHLSYNMLLNQLRCEEADPESMLRNSFYQFQADRSIPDLELYVEIHPILLATLKHVALRELHIFHLDSGYVGAIILYTYVFHMLAPPPEGTFDNEDGNVPLKIPQKDGSPENVPLLEQEASSMDSDNSNKGKILAMVIGAVPVLKKIIFTRDAPLYFFTDSCIILGKAMIPCILLALGGNPVDGPGPGSSRIGVRTLVAIIIGRLILVPPAGLGIVTLADKLGFLPADDKMFRFVLLLQHSMPTSVLSGAVANLRGYGKEAAASLFWVHIFAVFSMAGWIILYLNILF